MHPLFWLEEAFGSRAKVRVLRTLAEDPRRTWTERELAHASRLSPNTVNLAARALAKAGLLDVRRLGRTHAVQLRGSAATEALRGFFVEEAGMMALVEDRIRHAVPPGCAAYLYGSTLWGVPEAGSDVDLLLVAEDDALAEQAAGDVLALVPNVFPARLEIIALGRAKYRRRARGPLMRRIAREGRPLGPKRLEDFL